MLEKAQGNQQPLWSVNNVAEYLNLPVSSIYKMTGPKAKLKIPHVRIAGRLRFRKADVDRWLDVLTVSNIETLTKAVRVANLKKSTGYGVYSS